MNRRRFFQATIGLFGAARLAPAAPMIPRRTMYARVHISAEEIRQAEGLLAADFVNDGAIGPWLGISREIPILPGLLGQQIVVESVYPFCCLYQPVDRLK